MMANSTTTTGAGGNMCLKIVVDHRTDHVEDKDNIEAAVEELLNLYR